jgi:GTP-sensing pleiotropic transcriptional regulator CodY
MLYWSEHCQSSDGWFYKTNMQWMDELCLTRHKVLRALRKLEGTGFIQITYRKVGGDRVCHYRILEAPLMAAINHAIGLN